MTGAEALILLRVGDRVHLPRLSKDHPPGFYRITAVWPRTAPVARMTAKRRA